MKMRQPVLAAAAWTASLALLMAFLAPTLSHAFAKSGNAIVIDVCSALGSKSTYTLVIDDGKSAPMRIASSKHCPYCHSSSGAPPLASALYKFWLPTASCSHPRPAYVVPTPLATWTIAQARGPPTV